VTPTITYTGRVVATSSTPSGFFSAGGFSPGFDHSYAMDVTATLNNGTTGGLNISVALTSVSHSTPQVTSSTSKTVLLALSGDGAGHWQADQVGAGWGNLHWEVQATGTSSTFTGQIRIHNEFIPPWTDAVFGEDTGLVSFSLQRLTSLVRRYSPTPERRGLPISQ